MLPASADQNLGDILQILHRFGADGDIDANIEQLFPFLEELQDIKAALDLRLKVQWNIIGAHLLIPHIPGLPVAFQLLEPVGNALDGNFLVDMVDMLCHRHLELVIQKG